jgi:pSer/pThr/pTyr-binding forkhead associated (FHA) protein
MANTPRLIILSEQLRGQRFELTKDIYTCGRIKERDICIPDPTISTHHCDFVLRDGSYVLVDHGSTNGTRVNNIPVTEQTLQNTDILQIGGIEILFDCDDKSMSGLIKTQTNISLDGADLGVNTVYKIENLDPFKKDQKKSKSSKMFMLVVIVMILLVLGLLAYLAVLMFGKDKNKKASYTQQNIPGYVQVETPKTIKTQQ